MGHNMIRVHTKGLINLWIEAGTHIYTHQVREKSKRQKTANTEEDLLTGTRQASSMGIKVNFTFSRKTSFAVL